MDIKLLEDTGLTKPQARAYGALITSSRSTAPAIATVIGESRSNTYKVLDRLCELNLAYKDTSGPKTQYFPQNPTALEQLIRQRSAHLETQERKLTAGMPDLLHFFFSHSQQPGIRFYQGKSGIEHIFSDMLKTGADVYLLRSPADVDFYNEEFFSLFRNKRAKLGITTYALTPDVASAIHDPHADEQNRFVRTWIAPEDYTANVEWDIYGDKVALISYGEEAMGIIIESPQIAESFRQVFKLSAKVSPVA